MPGVVDEKLRELGITLPPAPAPAANYAPYAMAGGLLFVAGQLPKDEGGLVYEGKLGDTVSLEDGQAAARLCALNILAQARSALGDLDRITMCLRLNGFVNGTPEFTDQPSVINGASDLIGQVLGDAGIHSRIAVGVASLPMGAAVEVDGIFAVQSA
jgi:enamine deaminase RidA (YjgF/YER057c/UK114 family)